MISDDYALVEEYFASIPSEENDKVPAKVLFAQIRILKDLLSKQDSPFIQLPVENKLLLEEILNGIEERERENGKS
jgi:hypothetical protein